MALEGLMPDDTQADDAAMYADVGQYDDMPQAASKGALSSLSSKAEENYPVRQDVLSKRAALQGAIQRLAQERLQNSPYNQQAANRSFWSGWVNNPTHPIQGGVDAQQAALENNYKNRLAGLSDLERGAKTDVGFGDEDMKNYINMQHMVQTANLYRAGKGVPAPIQIANEVRRRLDAGDVAGANLILQAGKVDDKGINHFAIDDKTGMANAAPSAISGYGPAVGSIAADKKGMARQAEKDVDLVANPKIKAAETRAEVTAKNQAETTNELQDRMASLPQLETTVDKLGELADKATYTIAGRGLNSAMKEVGLPPREAAIARREYTSLIDNQILPLLRQTFGAQFTAKEGDTLRETLGDVNATPEEKKAVLRSFIEQKKQTINTKERQAGMPVTQWGDSASSPSGLPAGAKKAPDGHYYVPDPSRGPNKYLLVKQ